MKALFTKEKHSGNIAKNRREKSFVCQYTVIQHDDSGRWTYPVTVRVYNSQASTTACVWLNKPQDNIHLTGGGKATGYGYHRASAAVGSALEDAGIVISEPIDGRGESAILDALTSIAHALDIESFTIHTAQG